MRRLLPPSRSRRIAKWTGLMLCVVILAMWAVSVFWRSGNPKFYTTQSVVYGIWDGAFSTIIYVSAYPTTARGWSISCRACGYELLASKTTCPTCRVAIAPPD